MIWSSESAHQLTPKEKKKKKKEETLKRNRSIWNAFNATRMMNESSDKAFIARGGYTKEMQTKETVTDKVENQLVSIRARIGKSREEARARGAELFGR